MISLGISFDGFVPIRDAVEIAKLAENCGIRSFWVAEHLGYRETFATSLALAQATAEARIFPTSVSPYLRHPTPTAMALASLSEYLPGRFGIAVGVGNPMFLRESGIAIEKPLKAVRDYVAAMRELMSCEPVTQEGLTFRLAGARMAFTPEDLPPIYLAPMGPKMLELSGEIGDGLVLSAGLTARFAGQSIEKAVVGARRSKRDPERFGKASYLYFIAGGDRRERDEKVRQKLAFLFRNENLRANIHSSGLDIDQEAVMAAIARRDIAAATALIPQEAVEVFAIAGDANECRTRLEAYANAGVEECVLSLLGTAEDKHRSLKIARTF
ncbi:MAG: LLM class flavin-dependent oxidoreductase [Planctomycetaceae bacterium]|nr:LLM class flavin-dependent oxidoreductase [Planctomycetaceae bacterium]